MKNPSINYTTEVFKYLILKEYLKYNPSLKGFTIKFESIRIIKKQHLIIPFVLSRLNHKLLI